MEQKFWRCRMLGQISKAREILAGLESSGKVPLPELSLMRNSLTRTDRGGADAMNELKELASLFQNAKPFQFFYQQTLNLYAQGLFAQALEPAIHALSQAAGPIEELGARTTHLLILQNLGMPTKDSWSELDLRIARHRQADSEFATFIERVLLTERLHQQFIDGDLRQLIANAPDRWSNGQYFAAWVASLPYARLERGLIDKSLEQLTSDADFYLRSYRLQTLIGRAYHVTANAAVSWGDRCERLYLWTWRWLTEPTSAHAQAVAGIVQEIEAWDGHDVLSVNESHMMSLALEWLLVFEPSRRSRWAPLMRRLEKVPGKTPPLFAFERLWLGQTRGEPVHPESHPLASHPEFRFSELLLRPVVASAAAVLSVDPHSGQIWKKGKRVTRSQALANLIVALLEAQGRLSFTDALEASFAISPFDPDIHLSKLHNSLARLRDLLGRSGKLKTKNQWIFLEVKTGCIERLSGSGRERLVLPPSRLRGSGRPSVRNERSLSALLKEASKLQGKDFTRAELESILSVPKATLNRYLHTWEKRQWIEKTGSGRGVRYRLTFFDS